MNHHELDEAILNHMNTKHIVGLAACRVQDGEMVWANGYGWADIAAGKPMTPDTIQNIASVSKTITCTALMQLWEQEKIRLDDPAAAHLPFRVVHPQHAKPITIRHLLTHTSGIADSDAYEYSYACGDPAYALMEWVQSYLVPGGRLYDADANFHPWEPGEQFSYSNVGYGLLGCLVESLSGEPFNRYCRKHIFEPLGMHHTGYLLNEVDLASHALPYAVRGTPEIYRFLYAVDADPQNIVELVPLCLYSFPTLSDGLVRTSARDLARFAAACSAPAGRGIPLKLETMQRCLTLELAPRQEGKYMRGLGLTWFSAALPEAPQRILYWDHSGGDPGVNTLLQLSPESRAAIVILTNSNHSQASMDSLAELVWQA